MNLLHIITNLHAELLAMGERAPQMLIIVYWLLVILWAIGSFGWRENPNVVRGTAVVQIILFAILGYYQFGF